MTPNVLRPAVLICVLTLVGCSGDNLTRSFGFSRSPPDEFTVTTRAPLSMPPDLTLRPPQPGAPRPQEQTASDPGQAALDPEAALAAPTAGTDSPGQEALIRAAGPPPAPGIRGKVDQEAASASDNPSLTDKLMFWKEPTPPGTVVDAQKEAQRLRENAALGQQPDTGDTPVIQRKQQTFFDRLF
jgi:hypothetical protein